MSEEELVKRCITKLAIATTWKGTQASDEYLVETVRMLLDEIVELRREVKTLRRKMRIESL